MGWGARKGFRALGVGLLVRGGAAWGETGGVVLALSGGGTKGFAHVGVIQVLERAGIPVAGIVGTSMGSIIGGLRAAGYDGASLEEVVRGIDLPALLDDRNASSSANGEVHSLFRRTFDRRGRSTGPLGIMEGKHLLSTLHQLTAQVREGNFDDLPIPFVAVATDMETGETLLIRRGSLASALRASMAIPGFFEPWPVEGRMALDGGLVANLPVHIAKEVFPGYPVVAVDVSSALQPASRLRNAVEVFDQSTAIMTRQGYLDNLRAADLVIRPAVGDRPMLESGHVGEIVALGRQAAEQELSGLLRLAAAAPPVPPRPARADRTVAAVRVEGLSPVTGAFLEHSYSSWVGRPFDAVAVLDACETIKERDDVGVVEYRLEDAGVGQVAVVLQVHPAPDVEIRVGGYTSNLAPERWLAVEGVQRGVWAEGDILTSELRVGEDWGAGLHYFAPVSGFRRMEYYLEARSETVTPHGMDREAWDRYVAGVRRFFWRDGMEIGWGIVGERVEYGGETQSAWGPKVSLSWSTLDNPDDPTEGVRFQGNLWWSNLDALLWTADMLWVQPWGAQSRLLLSGGVQGGDASSPAHAAYLGGPKDLFHLASTPWRGERSAWVRLGIRRMLWESVLLGPIYGDLFVTRGALFDEDWDEVASPWEAGLALAVPGKLLGGRVLVIYDGDGNVTFGFELGSDFRRREIIP
ncbi:MAG TPA: patatin-like phospholipase family protein [Synergistaceae bacterium]|nr:patatin-like phospholipase family protein [Synergistaceae bacterium]